MLMAAIADWDFQFWTIGLFSPLIIGSPQRYPRIIRFERFE
jgi:hypothetical protein